MEYPPRPDKLVDLNTGLKTVTLLSQQPPDIMLKCGGHVRAAHKLILPLGSKYFEKMLLKFSGDGGTIVMPANVPVEHLEYILLFIYNGFVEIPDEVLEGVIRTAKFLQVVGLSGPSAN